MDTMLVAVFDDEPTAYKAVEQLARLHAEQSIALYSGAVITKDSDGRVRLRESRSEWPIGVTIGAAIGTLVGVLGGVPGMMAGAAAGIVVGMPADVYNLSVESDFITEVGDQLAPGKSAVVVETQEGWKVPVDVEMETLGGKVYRRSRREVEDNQYDG